MLSSLNAFFYFIDRIDLKVKFIKQQRKIYCSKDKELTKEEYLRLLKESKKRKNLHLNLLIQTICATGIRRCN